MRQIDDSEFMTPSPEEQREAQAQEQLRELVREEVRRIRSGERDAEMAAEEQREQQAEADEQARRERYRWLHNMAMVFTGEILIRQEVRRLYGYLYYMAALLLLSIVVLFTALHIDTRRDKLEREVQLLHEKSIRYNEQRYKESSHSAILRRLEERGIKLTDPQRPATTIE